MVQNFKIDRRGAEVGGRVACGDGGWRLSVLGGGQQSAVVGSGDDGGGTLVVYLKIG